MTRGTRARTCHWALVILRQRLLLHKLVEHRPSQHARPPDGSDRDLGFGGVCGDVVSGHG